MNREYQVYRNIAYYMRLQYPKVLYHFDPTGLNLSKTQSGQLKAIQGGRGYPDLFIIEPSKDGKYHGLFIEIKAEGTRILKKDGTFVDTHVEEQGEFMKQLEDRHFKCYFGVGFDDCMRLIDIYLKI
jgi:hypothetical protein